MNRTAIVIALAAGLIVAGCSSSKEDDINSLPVYGQDQQLPPQPVSAPRAPDVGTYNGQESRYGARPPQSGLNADPANPNGAPGGSYSTPGALR